MSRAVLYLNSHRAKSGTVAGHKLSKGHRFLAKFFGCGPVDRTGTLDAGFPVRVAQPIPVEGTNESFGRICEAVAADLIAEAVRRDVGVQVAWSGGIDSTLALIALTDAARATGELERLEVRYTTGSISEYPLFFERFVHGHLRARPSDHPLPETLSRDVLTVTGELGDQLFGSDYLAPLVKAGLAQRPFAQVMPAFMTEGLGKEAQARHLLDYLSPLVEGAPLKIGTVFEYVWWLNFALKWQMVSLRLPAFVAALRPTTADEMRAIVETTRPFFGDERFQRWSLSHPELRTVTDWRKYKLEAKKLILRATDDFDYYTTKEKQPSLKNVIVDRKSQGKARYRLVLYDDYTPEVERFARTEGR